ncbi:fibrous sheath CABYR-binding protein isoform X2 [Hippocampus comes]|uniref:fibrous sheath CABYR-binding protein isoform X2 n=1 Tax=Hippocampus comes TaxID=109280 RepID=UPI00094E1454|nr:PREDICTED: fibrous sheath CABYR-binding protein-like isoform X2 [Hippocampus comes]
MFCRRVCQRLGPVAQRVFTPTFRKAPVRHMAFGVPGGSTNMTYFVVCGGGLTAAVVYAYKTVLGDSERYEDRLANMGSTAKASSAEPVNAAAEPAPVDEPEAPVEVITESVAAPAEPVADSTDEPVVESATPEEDVAVVSEIIATEDEAMPSAVEDAPPVVAEAAPILEDAPPVMAEAAPTPVEVTEETPAEAPASAEPVPDLLTAVKILTGSTVEIAAASVGESNLVRAARKIEDDGKRLDSVLEVIKTEALEGTKDLLAAKESSLDTVVVTNEEELDPAEVLSCDEEAVAEVKVSAEETTEAALSPATEEEEEVPSEKAATSGPTEDNAGGVDAEDQNPDPVENNTLEEASPKEAAPSVEASITAEAPVDEELPTTETFGEDATEAEAPEEETVAASEEEGTTQPPEAENGSEMEALSATEPESNCHDDSLAQLTMPTADQPSEILEDAGDETNESSEAASPEETPSPEAVVVMMSQS